MSARVERSCILVHGTQTPSQSSSTFTFRHPFFMSAEEENRRIKEGEREETLPTLALNTLGTVVVEGSCLETTKQIFFPMAFEVV